MHTYTDGMFSLHDKELDHLFDLVRIKPESDKKKRKKLLHDLDALLGYFGELQKLSTDNIEPLSGGTLLESVTRADQDRVRMDDSREQQRRECVGAFPQKENESLKVPPVFGAEDVS